MQEPVHPAILGALSAGAIWFFWPRVRAVFQRPPDHIVSSRYGLADGLFCTVLAAFFLMSILGSAGPAPVITAKVILQSSAFYLFLVLAVVSFLVFRGISPVEVFGLLRVRGGAPVPGGATDSAGFSEAPAPGGRDLPISREFLHGIGWLAAAYPIILFMQAVSYRIAGEAPPQDLLLFLINTPSFADRAVVIALAVGVAPLAEEVLFRGYLYGVARKYAGRFWAMMATALLFAGVHGHLPSLAGLFLFAVLLTLLYEKSGSLWVPIVVHALFNSVTVIVALYFPWIMLGE